jgi:ABC-type multidrug transport system fused ATPase/permease subunit
MKFFTSFFQKTARLISLKDIWMKSTYGQKARLIISSVFFNAVEAASKILGPLAMAKSFEMVAFEEPTTDIFGMELSASTVFYSSVFFNLVSLVTPEMRQLFLYGIEESYGHALTDELLRVSQEKTVTLPKHMLGNELLKPLQKHIYSANNSIPKLMPIVTGSIQPLICDTVLGTIIAYSRFGSPVGSVLLGYIVISTITNELLSYLTKASEKSSASSMLFSQFMRNWFDVLSNAETVILFNRSELEIQNAQSDYKQFTDKQKSAFISERVALTQTMLTSFLQIAASIYVARGGFHEMQLDDIVFLLGYATNIGRSVHSISRSFRSGLDILSHIDEVNEFIGVTQKQIPVIKPRVSTTSIQGALTTPLIESGHEPNIVYSNLDSVIAHQFLENKEIDRRIKSATTALEFKNVSFCYKPGENTLSNISFKIPAGKTIGIVGSSNCGKTTLTKLLCGILEPSNDEAQIHLFGMPIQQIPKEKLRRIIGITRQQAEIFKDRAPAYNIFYGFASNQHLFALRNNREDTIEQDELTTLHDTLSDLADKTKLQTIMGRDKSAGLSGGEEQRLGIARILSKNAQLFIFDEPTSQLDSKTESEILKNIKEVTAGKTVLMIAHRLSTIKSADCILVLKNDPKKGTYIAEQGTHKELVAQNGVYAELWQLQTKEAVSEHKVALQK